MVTQIIDQPNCKLYNEYCQQDEQECQHQRPHSEKSLIDFLSMLLLTVLLLILKLKKRWQFTKVVSHLHVSSHKSSWGKRPTLAWWKVYSHGPDYKQNDNDGIKQDKTTELYLDNQDRGCYQCWREELQEMYLNFDRWRLS